MKISSLLLLILLCFFTSCKQTVKKEAVSASKQIVELIVKKGIKLSPQLEQSLSVLPESSRNALLDACRKNSKMLSFINENPTFIVNWDYLRKKLPTKSLDPDFLKMFIYVDDYAKYGGNKLQNYVYKEAGNIVEVYDAQGKIIYAKIHPGKIIEILDGNINNWFTQLKPLSSTKYLIDDAEYTIDNLSRVSRAKFKITPASLTKKSVRDQNVQQQMHNLKGSLSNDQAGHLLADEFGGSSNMINLVPMTSRVNKSVYRSIENKWKQYALQGKNVKVNIDLKYEGTSERPKWINVEYEVDGKHFFENIENI
ncbi:MAG: DNA/RNA non-specific endonuclease [Firmicutes bacterium]|nr:DNA/RNA non-specific endonuclease [Candidatus Alectryobacillus merdavium]